MITIQTVAQLQEQLARYRGVGKTIGFVPTMGALHRGHLNLMERAKAENDVVVVSIFVNPTQFNNPNDLKNYPRTLETDLAKCKEVGVSVVFAPEVSEVYPSPDNRVFDFGQLDKVMEGKHRPGHFNGVAQVVSKLFEMVMPNKAYFGQKDFQQLAIIRRLVEIQGYDIDIVSCPTVREADGLAMSSRNMLLNQTQRQSAPLIAKTLMEARNKMGSQSVSDTIGWVISTINTNEELRVEYFVISNARTLEPIKSWPDATNLVGCIAVQVGSVRLIDNILF